MKIKALESKNIEGVMYQEGKEYDVEIMPKELKCEEIKENKTKEIKMELKKEEMPKVKTEKKNFFGKKGDK